MTPTRALSAALFVVALLAAFQFSPLLATSLSAPGTESARAGAILKTEFSDGDEGRFVVVFRTTRPVTPDERALLEQELRRAATTVPHGFTAGLEQAGRFVLYGSIDDRLSLNAATSYTKDVRAVLADVPDARAFVTGRPATQADLAPVFRHDLAKSALAALLAAAAAIAAARFVRMPMLRIGARARVVAFAVLIAAAVPAYALDLTPGSTQGADAARRAIGVGAIVPAQVVVDARRPGAAMAAPVQAALSRLITELREDPEVARIAYRPEQPYIDPTGRYTRVLVAGRHDFGDPAAQAFARRLRSELIPLAAFPNDVQALAGGSSPTGIDVLDRAYALFPWLAAGIVTLQFAMLLRAWRSWRRALEATAASLLAVTGTYGVLALFYAQVDVWVPPVLFAVVFGLTALRRRIGAAGAVVMIAAFAVLATSSIAGLQELGVAVVAAVLLETLTAVLRFHPEAVGTVPP
jgi:hypothetical protein